MDLFINKAQLDAGFSERLKLKDKSVPTILDPMLQHISVSNCEFTWSLRGHLLPSLQYVTPIQTERSDEGV